MNPVMQTQLGGAMKDGDCVAACLASILELPLHEVPGHFGNSYDWIPEVDEWTRERGFALMAITEVKNHPPAYHVRVYERSEHHCHAVVGFGREVAHDPDPRSPAGFYDDLEPEACLYFICLDPARNPRTDLAGVR